jgi:cyanophycin synthetase
VIENSPASILSDGLAYDRCHVGIVTDLGGADALAAFDIHDSDQLARVLRTQVDVVLPEGVAVLNAADPRVAALASLCDGQVILYGKDAGLSAIEAHCAADGRAVVLQQGQIALVRGATVTPVSGISQLTSRRGKHQRDDKLQCAVLAAVAAAWALQISPDLISAGLKTFELDPESIHRSAKSLAAR